MGIKQWFDKVKALSLKETDAILDYEDACIKREEIVADIKTKEKESKKNIEKLQTEWEEKRIKQKIKAVDELNAINAIAKDELKTKKKEMIEAAEKYAMKIESNARKTSDGILSELEGFVTGKNEQIAELERDILKLQKGKEEAVHSLSKIGEQKVLMEKESEAERVKLKANNDKLIAELEDDATLKTKQMLEAYSDRESKAKELHDEKIAGLQKEYGEQKEILQEEFSSTREEQSVIIQETSKEIDDLLAKSDKAEKDHEKRLDALSKDYQSKEAVLEEQIKSKKALLMKEMNSKLKKLSGSLESELVQLKSEVKSAEADLLRVVEQSKQKKEELDSELASKRMEFENTIAHEKIKFEHQKEAVKTEISTLIDTNKERFKQERQSFEEELERFKEKEEMKVKAMFSERETLISKREDDVNQRWGNLEDEMSKHRFSALKSLELEKEELIRANQEYEADIKRTHTLGMAEIEESLSRMRSDFDKALEMERNELQSEKDELSSEITSRRSELREVLQEYTKLKESVLIEKFALNSHEGINMDEEYREKLAEIVESSKRMVRNETAWNMSKAHRRSKGNGVEEIMRLMMRSFNKESDSLILMATGSNVNYLTEQIVKSAKEINSESGKDVEIELAFPYVQLKIDELTLATKYKKERPSH